jgi:hypothetical protein
MDDPIPEPVSPLPKWRDEYGTPKYIDHREPFMLFGKKVCWTLLDSEGNMTDKLHLVTDIDAYHANIQRNLRLATLQGKA